MGYIRFLKQCKDRTREGSKDGDVKIYRIFIDNLRVNDPISKKTCKKKGGAQ